MRSIRVILSALLVCAISNCATPVSKKSDELPGYWRGVENMLLLDVGLIAASELNEVERAEIAEARVDIARRAWAESGFTVKAVQLGCRFVILEQKGVLYVAKIDSCPDLREGDRGLGDLGGLGSTRVQIRGVACDLKSDLVPPGKSATTALAQAC